MNVYFNREAIQIKFENRTPDGFMFYRGNTETGAAGGCWRVNEKDYIDSVDPDDVLPEAKLVGYSPPNGIYLVASWTEPDDEADEPRLFYYLIRKGNQRVQVYKFNQTPKNAMTAVKWVYLDERRAALTLCFELLV